MTITLGTDMWSMGCVMLQMVQYTSIPELKDRIERKIWRTSTKMDDDLKDVFEKILQSDHRRRMDPVMISDRQHPFFELKAKYQNDTKYI